MAVVSLTAGTKTDDLSPTWSPLGSPAVIDQQGKPIDMTESTVPGKQTTHFFPTQAAGANDSMLAMMQMFQLMEQQRRDDKAAETARLTAEAKQLREEKAAELKRISDEKAAEIIRQNEEIARQEKSRVR